MAWWEGKPCERCVYRAFPAGDAPCGGCYSDGYADVVPVDTLDKEGREYYTEELRAVLDT